MRVAGNFSKNGAPFSVSGVIRETGKKTFTINNEPCDRLATHIGQLPAVMIAPDDVQIILGTSEERRRFIDALICQIDQPYLQALMTYNKLLQQRNSYLKQLLESGSRATDLLDVLDQQLLAPAQYVFEQRKRYTAQLLSDAAARYATIAGVQYDLKFGYDSALHAAPMQAILQQNRHRDLASGRTQGGVHRDDISIQLDEQPFRQTASQGQRKSLLFALKLAEFELLKQAKGFAPLLLLDDVFEKLDAVRMQNLLTEVCVSNNGQVFVTDTHSNRLSDSFRQIGTSFQEISCG